MYNNQKGIEAYKELLEYICDSKTKISHVPISEQYELIRSIYLKCKELSNIIYENGKKTYYLNNILDLLHYCEDYLRSYYIMEINEEYLPQDITTLLKNNEILDYITNIIRHRIITNKIRRNNILYVPTENICDIDLTDCCEEVSALIKEECDNLGIECKIVRIDPGFNRKKSLYQHTGFHYFCLVKVYNKTYLYDLTYKQFFKGDRNILSRIGVVGLAGCLPGAFMVIDEDRKKLAEDLITKGYIEFTEKNIKNYFDGFAMSVRNGTYYELLGKIDYTTNYTSEDYLNFIVKKDDMFNHEPREGLGLQLKPLKNPHLDFEIKK